MKHIITFLATFFITTTTFAQIGINTVIPDISAALDITSTTGGLLVPRMTETQRDAISAAKGLVLFNTTTNTLQINEGDATTANWVSLSAAATSATYNIGDVVNGGVVFYIFESDEPGFVSGEIHGLVCAFSDYATSVEWGCYGQDLPNVPNVSSNPPIGLGAEIGDGVSNTNAILNDCPTAPAALAARSLGAQWFLPSVKDLNQMYINKTTLEGVSGFSAFSNYYWSSTEYDTNSAWIQNFSAGNQANYYKYYTVNVRAVRAF
ncbi:hypothetical protein BTO04_10860 [Polaribacter sp. SA4-10]|uniref:DUF1566 domain-containing protein n=1 Tax=Polaribacter sp. SA4-10 TaxID=754397 RepID=UPI000B3D38B4|nr:DUF1566 domain-containing protein [Polaribacter sp. SA4-10]ARV07156.1 hypothetical protein BTO04_10860 [Polaribacter sp. SA4-10]